MSRCDFRTIQQRFTHAIRQQTDYAPPPCGEPVDPRRFQVYRDLFLNNVSQFFASVYPVCHEVLGAERWRALMVAFLAEHEAHTPYFHFLGQEFLSFLRGEAYAPEADPPWLVQLADWEWCELAVSIEAADAPAPFAPELSSRCALSPLARVRAYDWPVHQADPSVSLAAQPTWLLIWRDGAFDVHYAQLAPMMAALLNALDGQRTLSELLTEAAEACGQPVETLWAQARPFVHDLAARGALASA